MSTPRSSALPGLVTLAAMSLAFILANSPFRPLFELLHHLPVALQIGTVTAARPLILWVNDGLMAFFFLLIGLELKREMLEGHLSTTGARAGPALAATGGIVVPAAVYLAVNTANGAAAAGWAIPAATDIVLVVTLLTLAGPRIPPSVRVFVTALATLDDLAAIGVIAFYYAADLSGAAIGLAAGIVLVLAVLNRAGIKSAAAYAVTGGLLWIALSRSGVHATLAGVLVGFAVPLRSPRSMGGRSPLRTMENRLRPWVNYGVVPVFAFLNSGIPVDLDTLVGVLTPVSMGIVLGLFAGKQVGIFGACWLAARAGLARLPEGASWRHIYGVAVLSGVGFTMSVFIAGLAFDQPEAFLQARVSVILGSLLSAVAGLAFLRVAVPHPSGSDQPLHRPREASP